MAAKFGLCLLLIILGGMSAYVGSSGKYSRYSVKTVQHIFVRNAVNKNIVNYSKHLNLCTLWAEHGISIVSKPSVTQHVSVLQTELRWLWMKIPLMFGEPLLSFFFCKGNRM